MKSVAFFILFIPSMVAAQSATPRFERGPCPGLVSTWGVQGQVECGHLIVPALREQPDRGTVRLAVVILRATQPSSAPPVVYLHGGPGGNGIASRFPVNAVRWQLNRDRDVVIYDQRGAGFSEPKLCPDVVQRGASFSRSAPETARACVASLKAAGIEPSAFTTPASAADAIDLRRALRYQAWDVYGVSYGSRLALELMRRDASGIRAVALSGPLPPGPLVRAQHPLSLQRALERVFTKCAAQAACAAAFPSVEQDFYALYAELTGHPLEVNTQSAAAAATVRLDGVRFVREVQKQLASARLVPRIPLLIHELRHGDRQKAARALVSADIQRLNPVLMLVSTFDVCGPELRAAWESVKQELAQPFVPFVPLVDMLQTCELWQERFADGSTYAPVQSDIPTLILTTEFDDRTPPPYGRQLASTLKRSFVYEFPGLVHAVEITSVCYESVLLSFLQDPTNEPDASCIAATPPMAFETKSLEQRRFVIRITSTSEQHAALAGTWQAVLPGPESTVRFDLKAGEGSLSGSISPNATANLAAALVPIFDGRSGDGVLTFKAISPDGARTITFTGTLAGDELNFVREVLVPPGAPAGREGVFGVLGPNAFTATRVD
jgi:pimeloyl-ACP methyl ester carboxylesterase